MKENQFRKMDPFFLSLSIGAGDRRMKGFEATLGDLQPSQLYICSDKLEEIEHRLRTEPLDALPVKRLGGRTVLTDGHTRAFAAFRQGMSSVQAYEETDELDWEAYQICVRWCLQAGITAVADLEARVVPAEQYETAWLQRCAVMHQRLAAERKGRRGTTTG